MPDAEFHLRPVYLVLGLSPDHRAVTEQLLADVRDELATQQTLGDRIRLGVIEFSGQANVRLPLCDPLDPTLPMLPPPIRGDESNSLAAALTAIRETIAADATTLIAAGQLVDRPMVWLIVDRDATDDPDVWHSAFRELTDAPGSPYILPCGVGSMPDEMLRTLIHPSGGQATVAAYRAQYVEALVALLASAIVMTASHDTSQPRLVLPEPGLLPSGVRMVPVAEPTQPVSRSPS